MLPPLRFAPLFRRYLWGGRRLHTVLGKPIGDGDDFAESWEIVDHREGQSVVQFGDHAGATLHDLVAGHGPSLFGRHDPPTQFPLLLKFLDANRDLSVQVHPNDAQGATLDPPDLGKTEAWVIVRAEPGSKLYAGLRPGVDRESFAEAIAANKTESCLHVLEPAAGDCVFIPAGTVHALGAGLVVAEIQQASDTTFRLFDWNRLGADGNPRQLHIEQALSVIDFERGPVDPQVPMATEDDDIRRLVECDKFLLDRWTIAGPKRIAGDHRCHLLAILSGSIDIENDPADRPLTRGETMLIPASAGALQISPRHPTVLLDMYMPL